MLKAGINDTMPRFNLFELYSEPGRTMMESFKNRVNRVLNKARDNAGSSAHKSLSESNNLKAMVTAGSKGSSINISLMTACVGNRMLKADINDTMPSFNLFLICN